MNRYLLAFTLAFTFVFRPALHASFPPDEGMWLPLLVKRLNYEQMQKLGCRLTPEEIYDVNNSSLKDAVVQLGGFCTAEVVSGQGLLLTNHHCAFDAIRSHTTVENDYLTNGFWASSKADELAIEGLSVKFLIRMEDVTQRVLDKIAAGDPADRDAIAEEEGLAIAAEVEADTLYTAEVKDMFYGNEYYLFVYQIYNDIRLVGAPPSAVGKFGGDTDNWMWPRHTGDFSVLRIYANAENKPAEYSPDNKPYTPKHFLPVSIKGVNEGDYAMIMGYPGSTDRYLTSSQIDQIYYDQNPDYVMLMEKRLDIMKADMDASPEVRIKLASNYASLANYYKYCLGQNNTLRNRGLQAEKKVTEDKFRNWVNSDASLKEQYGEVLDEVTKIVSETKSIQKLQNYFNFAGFGPGFVSKTGAFVRLKRILSEKPQEKEAWNDMLQGAVSGVSGEWEEYNQATDRKIFAQCLKWMKEDLPDYQMELFTSKLWTKATKGSSNPYEAYASYTYENSIIFDADKLKSFSEKPSAKVLENDPAVAYVASLFNLYRNQFMPVANISDANKADMMRRYMDGIRRMNEGGVFYPDANSTMRLTYGSIKPYDPRDAVKYNWYTTTDGIFQKENPNDEEFTVPEKLMDLIEKKDFGQYGKNGQMNVCFLSNNDITGGNSGSPVINGNGELIGIAFDGNWESMASDLVFDAKTVRTISVDIRYVLFIIDKFAGASHLIDEMKLMK